MPKIEPASRDDLNQARVVSKHLDPAYTAHPDAIVQSGPAEPAGTNSEEQESSLKLQGGDMHRDLYKIDARTKLHQRSATFSHPRREMANSISNNAEAHRTPGGFRRQFLLQQKRFNSVTTPVTSNFVSFLDLYGAFAGEDLAESDEEDNREEDEEYEQQARPSQSRSGTEGERRPLLGRRKSSRVGKKGDATMTKTFFLLLKSFIGTGVLFLPKAFKNGGLLFSSVTLVMVSLISCVAFHLLLKCRARYGGGYGEIGEAIGGNRMRTIVLGSITVSQIGFVCAGIIFTAENLYSFLDAVVKGSAPLSINALIGIQLLLLVPLALIRNISKLGSSALLADVCILIGLGYISYYDISSLAKEGINTTVQLFNPKDFTLTVGSAIFTFEGIGLILPIQSSMKEPQKFDRLLYGVMLLITIIFTSIGGLSYATFGDMTNVEIISNFPQDDKLVNSVQFLYSLAVLIGTPVQLFPAVRIIEGSLFGHLSGKRDSMTKWKKNAFRTGILCVCGIISALGASDLDKFVALIGSFACVPLVYIYPAYLHYKGIAENRYVKMGDIVFMVLGLAAMVYTTAVTIFRWSEA
ncbi:putative Amino acid transporter [Taphrina deformans PYCC 5710]|uniref:Amino acid transporter n=1 Tax=Taphrina deformans (strain PYCC 5710 / ATCC 11124 / CBS 356.35 / IMI 108563 / JCM 9778 / NBRC 8474) TaxID=1097556 RepID=R4X712_TAPDE|nr:putative Amino acid transporter [Taphrina deformans PYCC 5710]|eukprot:CCG80828.1 putative Amino acid transporter [Taphrina deformans PYCC 5710]